MSEKQKVNVKNESVDRKKVVAYLEALTASLKAGSLFVKHGTQEMALYPKGNVTLEVKASKKREKEKFGIEISWDTTPASKPGAELSISNKVPANFGKVPAKVAPAPASKKSAKKSAKATAKKVLAKR